MKHIKQFESYLDDINNIKNKIINDIKELFEKYTKLEYFFIGQEITVDDTDYFITSFNKNKLNEICLDYDIYNNKIASTNKQEKLQNLQIMLLVSIWDDIEKNNRMDPSYLLEQVQGDAECFIDIITNYKNTIKFSTWMFDLFYENSEEKELEKLKFQNVLFKHHPEATVSFLESNTKILPSILKKYPKVKKLYDEYFFQKDIKNFNL